MAKASKSGVGFVSGASASLNKTTQELTAFIGKPPKVPAAKLRARVHQMLAALAEKWMKRGFNRGHKESLEAFKKTKKVPSKLTYEGSRTLFTGQKKIVKLKSTVKRKKP